MLDDPNNYVLTDGQNYLTVNKKTNVQETTSNICSAKYFTTYDNAERFKNAMKKTLRIFNWQIKTIAECTQIEKIEFEIDNESDSEFLSKVKNIESFSKELLHKKAQLEGQLTETEQEIIDIEHAAEFYSLDAYRGFKIYKMLHDARIERRKCKDGIFKISCILDGNFQDCLQEKMSRRIEGLNHREYQPRVLKELFNV
jgi:hypothetical protein